MSLRDALNREPVDPRRHCGVQAWIDTLPEDEQEAAAALLASSRTGSQLFADFRAEGFPLQVNALRKHRVGDCACEPR